MGLGERLKAMILITAYKKKLDAEDLACTFRNTKWNNIIRSLQNQSGKEKARTLAVTARVRLKEYETALAAQRNVISDMDAIGLDKASSAQVKLFLKDLNNAGKVADQKYKVYQTAKRKAEAAMKACGEELDDKAVRVLTTKKEQLQSLKDFLKKINVSIDIG